MTGEMKPTIGGIVHYRLDEANADAVNRRREDYQTYQRQQTPGPQQHVGNEVKAGDVFPAMIVRVEDGWTNLQVFLDGNDVLWVSSVLEDGENGSWSWPTR